MSDWVPAAVGRASYMIFRYRLSRSCDSFCLLGPCSAMRPYSRQKNKLDFVVGAEARKLQHGGVG